MATKADDLLGILAVLARYTQALDARSQRRRRRVFGQRRCMEAGIESISPPERLEHWPVTAAFVRDPDGYMVEILEHHGVAPALSGPGRNG